MAAKILVNGVAGVGKSSLLQSLRNAFVISRDGKPYHLKIPAMVLENYHGMALTLYGGEVKNPATKEVLHVVEGIETKLQKYVDKFKILPETIVIDSVSKLMLDAMDYANTLHSGWDIHSCINAEITILTKFIQEYLISNNVNVVLINHVMENEKKGYIPIGQGKFKDKGGFYSEVNEAILIEENASNRYILTSGKENQARTEIPHLLQPKMYLENFIEPKKTRKLQPGEKFYSLQEHIDLINSVADEVAGFIL
jgi:hypothetical protein